MGVSKRLAVWLVKPVRQLLTLAQSDRRLALDAPESDHALSVWADDRL